MPTKNRVRFLARSIDCFLKQDYPRKQLLICEEGSRSLNKTEYSKKMITYMWISGDGYFKSIGEKRNAMCASAADTDLIAHWDDDDWHSPQRLSTQIKQMRAEGSRLCGLDRLVFYNGQNAWLFKVPRIPPWLAGGTLIYERTLWQEQPFTEVSDGEDTAFVDTAFKRGVKISTVKDPSLYVAMLHDNNTTKRDTTKFGGFDAEQVRKWIGESCLV